MDRNRYLIGEIHRLIEEAGASQRSAVGVVLAHRKGLKTVRRLVEIALERGNNCTERAAKMAPPGSLRPIACKAGCSTCCILKVGVSAPEAIFVAAYLRSHRSAESLLDLQERLARLDATIRGLDETGRVTVQQSCALLEDRRCSVYPARPFACRWLTSPSHDGCVDVFVRNLDAGLTADYVRTQPLLEVWKGMKEGIEGVGLEGSTLELTAALRVALSDESVADRWLAGERVFASAVFS